MPFECVEVFTASGARWLAAGFLAATFSCAGCRTGAPANSDALRLGGELLFVSERSGRPQVHRGAESLTSGERSHFPAAVSKNGALVMVAVEQGEHHLEQLVLRMPDGGQRPLTATLARARNPSFSPDGKWLAYESSEESFSDIFRVDVDGAHRQRLTRTDRGAFEPSVSPDGQWVAYVSTEDGDPEIYRVPANGGPPERLTAFHREDVSPRWSPDGKHLAFVSNREGQDQVWLMRPDGSGQRRAHHELPQTTEGLQSLSAKTEPLEKDAVWSPDGKRLAYVVRRLGQKARIWVLDVESGERVALTDGASEDDQPAWSFDGKHLAFVSSRNGNLDIYVVPSTGGTPVAISRDGAPEWLPLWLPRQ